jgi:DNA polymerase zeta
MSRIPIVEARRRVLHEMCANCSGTTLSEPIACDSTDCPHLYSRKKVEAQVTAALQAEVVLERLR